MGDRAFLYEQLYERYGTVKRAKGPFLYTAKGVRLTDLYQEDGKAILGWGGSSAFTMLKNTLSRGATGSYVTDSSLRLQKSVCSLLGDERIVLTFNDRAKLLSLALTLFPEGTSFYKPWLTSGVNWSDIPCVALEPPLPLADSFFILAIKRNAEAEAALSLAAQKQGLSQARFSSPLEAAITRSIYDLIKALQERKESDWFIYDKIISPYWTRKGPYLYTKLSQSDYELFILHCLDCGLVINPNFSKPSIVPYGADAGVFSKLKNNPFRQNGGSSDGSK